MARKKSTKKTGKKRAKKTIKKHATRSKENTFFLVGLITLVILLIVVSLYTYTPAPMPSTDGVLVTVNGKPILQSMLDFQYGLLPPAYQIQASKDDVLKQIVDEELIVQASLAAGTVVTVEDVTERVQDILTSSGLSASDLNKNLETFNLSPEDFEELVQRQLVIQAYLDEHIVISEPTEADLRKLYESTLDQFAVDEQVTVRHVLISNQREEAAIVAKDVYDSVRAGDDFCDLVKEFSDDRGSKETCGEYTFPRGFMVPPFEQASFAMTNGQIRLVQTTFGYHIIEKITAHEAGTKSFAEVRDLIKNDFIGGEQLRQRTALIGKLRADADIVYHDEKQPAVEPAPTLAESEPMEEVVPQEPEPVVPQEPQVPVKEPMEQKGTGLDCIATKATLYGSSWSKETQEARALFADTVLTYVACDTDGEACFENQIQAYPTWVVDGKHHIGKQSVEILEQLTGC